MPWAYQGHELYKQLHRRHNPFPHEELHGEDQFHAWGLHHNAAENAVGKRV